MKAAAKHCSGFFFFLFWSLMETLIDFFRSTHIYLGFGLLVLFWLPILTRKGSKLHVWAGRTYFGTMLAVLLTAAVICAYRLFTGQFLQGLLLGLLTLISFNALWEGLVYARYRKVVPNWQIRMIKFLNVIAFVYGIPVTYFGVTTGQPLLLIFGPLAILANFRIAIGKRPAVRDITQSNVRLREHYAAMLISGGAAYTAFLAFGSRHFLDLNEYGLGILPWILPTILVFVVVFLYNKRYPLASET